MMKHHHSLILILIPEKIILRGIIRPNVFNAFVDITFILNLLQILKHLSRGTRTSSVIYQFFFCSRPRSVFKLRGQVKCPIHSLKSLRHFIYGRKNNTFFLNAKSFYKNFHPYN